MKKIVFCFIMALIVIISAGCFSPKITINTNGGTEVDVESNSIDVEPISEKEGYSFGGWYLEESCETEVVFPFVAEENVTLYAKWIKDRIINFDSDDGTLVESQINVVKHEPKTSKLGFEFMGWYSDESYERKVKFPFFADEDTTLYAKWLKDRKIIFESNGGSSVFTGTNEVQSAPNTHREGYEFLGWYFDKNFTEIAIFPMECSKDCILYAKWEAEKTPMEKYMAEERRFTYFTKDIELYDGSIDVEDITFQYDNDKKAIVVSASYYVPKLYIGACELEFEFQPGDLSSGTGTIQYHYEPCELTVGLKNDGKDLGCRAYGFQKSIDLCDMYFKYGINPIETFYDQIPTAFCAFYIWCIENYGFDVLG